MRLKNRILEGWIEKKKWTEFSQNLLLFKIKQNECE